MKKLNSKSVVLVSNSSAPDFGVHESSCFIVKDVLSLKEVIHFKEIQRQSPLLSDSQFEKLVSGEKVLVSLSRKSEKEEIEMGYGWNDWSFEIINVLEDESGNLMISEVDLLNKGTLFGKV